MTTTLALRDYQADAITSTEAAHAAGKRSVAAVLPTGAGKTVTFAHLIRRQAPGTRTLVLAHREELINQATSKIMQVCPDLRVGIVKGEWNQPRGDVTVATVQTISRPERLNRVDPYGLIIVDEAHHAAAESYRRVLGKWPDARILGVTATLARGDGAALGEVFSEVVYRLDILDLIEHDPPYLCDVRGFRVTAEGLDLKKVRVSHGDYRLGELEQQMTEAGAWEAAADAYRKYAADRVGVIFTPTVDTAHTVAELLNTRGITAEAVDGKTPSEKRRAILARFESGETQVVANCGVLTEGFDNPAIACVMIARPTRSAVLYTQMAGRGLRLHPGKKDCLILDLVGVTEDQKLATIADLTGRDITEVSEGESLREAHSRERTASITIAPYLGELARQEVELFERSAVRWPEWNGVYFVDLSDKTGQRTLYLAPSLELPGTYDVVLRDRRSREETVHLAGRALATAFRVGERLAKHHGGTLVRRDQPWHQRPASPAQIEVLTRNRIPIPEGCTSGQASELITTAFVSRDFTRRPPRGYRTGTEEPSAPHPRPATP